jgi:hypothetical protein
MCGQSPKSPLGTGKARKRNNAILKAVEDVLTDGQMKCAGMGGCQGGLSCQFEASSVSVSVAYDASVDGYEATATAEGTCACS